MNREEIQNKIDEIFDNHTLALTKKDDVTSFDEILVDAFKIKCELIDFIEANGE